MGFVFKKMSLVKILLIALLVLVLLATLIRGIAQDFV